MIVDDGDMGDDGLDDDDLDDADHGATTSTPHSRENMMHMCLCPHSILSRSAKQSSTVTGSFLLCVLFILG